MVILIKFIFRIIHQMNIFIYIKSFNLSFKKINNILIIINYIIKINIGHGSLYTKMIIKAIFYSKQNLLKKLF